MGLILKIELMIKMREDNYIWRCLELRIWTKVELNS
jgi:hypothetical protein